LKDPFKKVKKIYLQPVVIWPTSGTLTRMIYLWCSIVIVTYACGVEFSIGQVMIA